MKLSGFLLKLTKIALNTLIKSTNANIRTYNEENILNQPTLYVINHFTRMETFFLPYVISKITTQYEVPFWTIYLQGSSVQRLELNY